MTDNRTYLTTHPWLTFSADLTHAGARFWVMLGECQSKCEHIARVPLRPDTARELYKMYLAKGALASTAIEGNTLSEEEVLQHLDGKLKLPPSREYLRLETDNIIKACTEIFSSVENGETPEISASQICDMNRMVLRGLRLDEDTQPGQLRTKSVTVGRYRGAPAEDCEHLLDRLCGCLNSADFSPDNPLGAIAIAVLKAAIAHLYIAWIHPFMDGNGRTARLLEFQILISSGIPAASAHLLSNHYNLTRSEYYRQLDRASESGCDVVPFVRYAVEGFLDGLTQQLDVIWEQQWDVTWRNYVHELFRDKRSETARRRRHLALDLSRSKEPVPMSGLPDLSPRLARAYANKTSRTLARDVSALLDEGLVVRTPKGYQANRELVLRFLSPRRKDEGGRMKDEG